jgi:hypothetical protein
MTVKLTNYEALQDYVGLVRSVLENLFKELPSGVLDARRILHLFPPVETAVITDEVRERFALEILARLETACVEEIAKRAVFSFS